MENYQLHVHIILELSICCVGRCSYSFSNLVMLLIKNKWIKPDWNSFKRIEWHKIIPQDCPSPSEQNAMQQKCKYSHIDAGNKWLINWCIPFQYVVCQVRVMYIRLYTPSSLCLPGVLNPCSSFSFCFCSTSIVSLSSMSSDCLCYYSCFSSNLFGLLSLFLSRLFLSF